VKETIQVEEINHPAIQPSLTGLQPQKEQSTQNYTINSLLSDSERTGCKIAFSGALVYYMTVERFKGYLISMWGSTKDIYKVQYDFIL